MDLFSYFNYNDALYFTMTLVNLDMLYVSYAHMPCCSLLYLFTCFKFHVPTCSHTAALLLSQDLNAMLKFYKLAKMVPQWASSPEYIVYTQGCAFS